MHIETLRIRNFRRLQDVRIDLAPDISIFVGANNSGKTSASHALQLFMAASRERFSVHDFGAESWVAMDAFGDGVDGAVLPTISLDIWFHVDAPDLHRVVDLLPSLACRTRMRAEAPAGHRAPRDQDRYVMIELALSPAMRRHPFLPFLPLTVSPRRRRSLDAAALTSCDGRRHAEPDPNAGGARPPRPINPPKRSASVVPLSRKQPLALLKSP